MELSNFIKDCVKDTLRDGAYASFKHVSKISEKYLSIEEVKVFNNLIKSKGIAIEKAGTGHSIIIISRTDYISKLSKILEDTSKFKRVNIEERKALHRLLHKEERIIFSEK